MFDYREEILPKIRDIDEEIGRIRLKKIVLHTGGNAEFFFDGLNQLVEFEDGKSLDFFINIALSRIEYEVCAEFLCFFQTILLHIEYDKELWILHSCVGDHAKAKGACAGNDNDIFVCDLCAVYCMLGAAEWLDQKRLL